LLKSRFGVFHKPDATIYFGYIKAYGNGYVLAYNTETEVSTEIAVKPPLLHDTVLMLSWNQSVRLFV
jgi:hypothetical protein